MKSLIAVLLAALVGFGAGYVLLAHKQQDKNTQLADAEATWQNEKAFLEQALAEAKKKQVFVRSVTNSLSTTVTNRQSPAEVLEKLLKLNPNTGEDSRNRIFRQIVYHLGILADLRGEALPTI